MQNLYSHFRRMHWLGRVLAGAFLMFASRVISADHGAIDGIVSMREIELGGVKQTILLRGADRRNPVLLFLHGGPGVSEMPLAYKNRQLENDFVVVHWDQRGAGKSYHPDTPDMTIEQFVCDTIELTRGLRAEFGGRKIFLVGHSWGSLVGALAAVREPELFRAYVGISQFVSIPASERELDVRARAVAKAKGDARSLGRLEKLGTFPYPSHKVERQVNKIQKKLMGEVPNEFSAARFIFTTLGSPDYSLGNDLRLLRGIVFSGKALEKEIYAANLFRSAPRIEVPVYFFEGRHDTVLSSVVAQKYFDRLIAPGGKHFIWFEESNHWPQLEESARYRAMLRRVRLETNP